jgi:hypothetical protein
VYTGTGMPSLETFGRASCLNTLGAERVVCLTDKRFSGTTLVVLFNFLATYAFYINMLSLAL